MQLKRYSRYLGLVCVALLPLIGAEYHGQVKFNNLPMPGATVIATQGDKKFSAVSDQQGIYQFQDLPEGAWQIEIDKLGFTPIKQEVTVGSGLPGPSFTMKMLPLDQIETVSAPAPSVVVGPASTTAIPGQTPPTPTPTPGATSPPTPSLTSNARPAGNGRGGAPATPAATSFQRTDLKANNNAPTAPAEPAPEVTSELNQRAADGFLINGSAQNGASSPFAQSPAFGNNRRGGPRLYTYGIVVNESNSALNANSYSLLGANTEKPTANLLNGGVNFGGPIKIPHLLVRNGPQLTVNYNRVENTNSQTRTGQMPDDLQRAGNFSKVGDTVGPVQIFDPFTNQPFSGNIIPQSRISPQALALVQLFPKPNFAGSSAYNYQVPLIGHTHTDSLRIQVSKSFKRKNTITGIFGMSSSRTDQNSEFNFLDLTHTLGMQTTVSYRRSFTARFYGTFSVQFSRQSIQQYPFFSNTANISGAAGITGNDQSPLNWGPPSLTFSQSGINPLSDTNASINHNQATIYSYIGAWNHGRHNIQFGGDFRFQLSNVLSQSNPRGSFTFNRSATQQVGTDRSGWDFADFMLGVPDQSSISFGNADKYFRSKNPDLFIVDDWKITPGLSLHLVARWDYSSPTTELYNRLVNLDVAPGFTSIAQVRADSPVGSITHINYPSSLVQPDKREFTPQFGFAWRPFPASSMVVRGGYSINYNTGVYQAFATQMAAQAPFSKSLQVANSAATPLTLANGFYAPANVVTNSFALDPNFRVGYAQNWNLSVQRDLPASLVMLATYNGIKGTHQLQAFVPNTYPSGATNPCLGCPSSFIYYTSGGNSSRESGTVQLRRRLHNGFTAQAQYTYSKSIDDAAALGASTGSVAQNWLDLRGERGPSSFDQRHVANFVLQYTSGMGVGGGALLTGWRGKVLKDWTFIDNIDLASGRPLSPQYTPQTVGISPTVRPSYTGQDLYATSGDYFLNSLALSAPSNGQWGNAGRGSIRGPAQFTMNASMQRAFKLNDRFNLSVTIAATNPLNHPTFGAYNTLITNPQFGLVTNPNPMRSLSTQMRLTF